MWQDDLTFFLIHLSTICSYMILVLLLKTKKKTQIHFVFMALTLLLVVWNSSTTVESYLRRLTEYDQKIFINLNYFSICFIPVCIYLLGLIYTQTKISITPRFLLLFVFPVVTTFIIWTNDWHHLFFIRYSIKSNEAVYGIYYYFHSVYSYSLILLGLYFLFSSSIKNSGFFSKQSRLIFLGIVVPMVVNVIYSFNLFPLSFEINTVVFTFASICFAVAILKFNFLNIAPIALHTVVDMISDGFLVIDEENTIIEYNKTMESISRGLSPIRRNRSLIEVLDRVPGNNNLLEEINKAREAEASVTFQTQISIDDEIKHFTVEITPIIQNRNYLGTIILFKDITENVRHLADIEEKHAILMEQERMASLGQLIGGISHNLKTPIMSIAGAAEALKDLAKEYQESVGEASVTVEDHREIASEMHSWIDKIRPYCTYMTDIINAVKGQATQFNMSSVLSFTINELLKRIDLLMRYELIKYNCQLNTHIDVDINTELYGDVNNLVQIFDNIIINAIQAYEGKNGKIDLHIEDKEDSILFIIRDYAKGIPENIKDRLLKEMVTTKGKDGTGLGLFMSCSTIKGRFGGKMWFESEEGKGTSFFIQLPHSNSLA